jgi:hypothetical protein
MSGNNRPKPSGETVEEIEEEEEDNNDTSNTAAGGDGDAAGRVVVRFTILR